MLENVAPIDGLAGLTMPAPPAPFVWGSGGRRMTPEEVAAERAQAQQLGAAGMDYSPVGSWTQGLARVAQGLLGGVEERRANRAADANTAESRSVMDSLLGNKGDPNALFAAAANPYVDDGTRSVASLLLKEAVRPPQAAHFFEANNGDQGVIDPITGQVKIIYHDPTPKVNWITADNGDGTKTLLPMVNGQMAGGGAQPPATLPPDFDFGEGGPASAPGGFPGG